MIIGVMSDTHGDISAIRRAVTAVGHVDAWLHGGDYSQDAVFLAQLTGLKVTAVRGNCDGAVATKPDEYISAGPVRIWLTHGDRFNVKGREEELVWWARQYEVHAVVYGHTHVARSSWQKGILVFNPGSPSQPRAGSPSCGILEIGSDGTITPRHVTVPLTQK